jgi:hypothetical protein
VRSPFGSASRKSCTCPVDWPGFSLQCSPQILESDLVQEQTSAQRHPSWASGRTWIGSLSQSSSSVVPSRTEKVSGEPALPIQLLPSLMATAPRSAHQRRVAPAAPPSPGVCSVSSPLGTGGSAKVAKAPPAVQPEGGCMLTTW